MRLAVPASTRATSSVSRGGRAALPVANAEQLSCSPPLVREDGAQESAQDLAREPCVPSAAVSERIRKREHPLPDRDLGQHPVDEMGCGVAHAPSATGRTEAAALTREGHEPVVAAGVAVDTEEAVGEHAALEIGADLALDEAGDGGAPRSHSGEEGDELRADDFVKEGLLGLVSDVVGDGRASVGTGGTKRIPTRLSRRPARMRFVYGRARSRREGA